MYEIITGQTGEILPADSNCLWTAMENSGSLLIEIILLLAKKEKITEPFDLFINIPGINNNIGPCLLMLCKTDQG